MRIGLLDNPVLGRELTERMRGRRAWMVITLYLALLVGVLALAYQTQAVDDSPWAQPAVLRTAGIGRTVFDWIVGGMMLLVIFLVPGLTAGAIAGERERQTLVPLQITLLRPLSIVLGKIGASLAFLLLLVVASMPLLAVAYLIGGITVAQVVGAFAAVVATGLVLACLTLACSALCRRVQTATVVAYGVTLVLVGGTVAAYGAAAVIDRSRGVDAANPPVALLWANPLAATADLLGGSSADGSSSPFQSLKDVLDDDGDDDLGGAFLVARGNAAVAFGEGQADEGDGDGGGGLPFWAESGLLLGALSVAGVVVAARRVRTPADEER